MTCCNGNILIPAFFLRMYIAETIKATKGKTKGKDKKQSEAEVTNTENNLF